MFIYFLPLILLSTLSYIENFSNLKYYVKNKYVVSLVSILLIIFVGFRYEYGCDWDAYKLLFQETSKANILDLLDTEKYFEIGHSLISKLISLKFDFYMLIFYYSLLFIIPLIIFCLQFKRTFLALTISYPYYVVVVTATLRQGASISLLMLSFYFLIKNKNIFIYFVTFFSLLIHQSSILFNGLIIFYSNNEFNKKLNKVFIYVFYLFISILLIKNSSYIFTKIRDYFFDYYISSAQPAKGSIFVWILVSIPSFIFLKNISMFQFQKEIKKTIKLFSIISILFFPLIFFNSVVALRLMLYLFPSVIYISAHLPDINIFKLKSIDILNGIVIFAFINLAIWLRFANHAYCWLPYKNLLFDKIF